MGRAGPTQLTGPDSAQKGLGRSRPRRDWADLKRSRQPTQPSRPTPLVTPPAAEVARKQKRKEQKEEILDNSEEMELASIRQSTYRNCNRFNKEFDCDCYGE